MDSWLNARVVFDMFKVTFHNLNVNKRKIQLRLVLTDIWNVSTKQDIFQLQQVSKSAPLTRHQDTVNMHFCVLWKSRHSRCVYCLLPSVVNTRGFEPVVVKFTCQWPFGVTKSRWTEILRIFTSKCVKHYLELQGCIVSLHYSQS